VCRPRARPALAVAANGELLHVHVHVSMLRRRVAPHIGALAARSACPCPCPSGPLFPLTRRPTVLDALASQRTFEGSATRRPHSPLAPLSGTSATPNSPPRSSGGLRRPATLGAACAASSRVPWTRASTAKRQPELQHELLKPLQLQLDFRQLAVIDDTRRSCPCASADCCRTCPRGQ